MYVFLSYFHNTNGAHKYIMNVPFPPLMGPKHCFCDRFESPIVASNHVQGMGLNLFLNFLEKIPTVLILIKLQWWDVKRRIFLLLVTFI